MSGGTTMLAAKEQAFIDLHTQHSARVYRYIACRISDRHRAEELAADVFRIAWEKQLAEPPGIGWLLATARNVVGNEYKGRRRRQELVERLKDDARSQAPRARTMKNEPPWQRCWCSSGSGTARSSCSATGTS